MSAPADGRYEVVAVRYGTQETTRSEVFLDHFVYGEPDAPATLDYYFWVVRNDHRTVVVDTGFKAGTSAGWGVRQRIAPAEALSLLAVDTDAATVVLTHAHFDHVGNLDLFPNSPMHLAATEYDFWTGPMGRRPLYRLAVHDDDIAALRRIRDEGRLHLHNGRVELAPGIEVLEVGGHSPGQCLLTVETSAGRVVLTSDAVHLREELDRDMPFFVVSDLAAMYAGYDVVRDLARSGAVVVPGHEPDVLTRHRPLGGPLAGHAVSIGGAA